MKVDYEKLEAVPEYCYLRDMLSAGGGCELAAITRCKCALGKFRQLLPVLINLWPEAGCIQLVLGV